MEWKIETRQPLILGYIKKYLSTKFSISVCLETVRNLFKRLELTRKKPIFSYTYANEKKQKEFLLTIGSLLSEESIKSGNIDVCFMDETTIQEMPNPSRVWCYKNEQPTILITGGHQKRIISGVINIRTGNSIFVSDQKQSQYTFIEFLKNFKSMQNGRFTHLFIDNHRSHLTGNVKNFYIAEGSWLKVHYLPKYSPKLNPIERIWKFVKKTCCYNNFYKSFGSKLDNVYDYLDSLENNPYLILKYSRNREISSC